MGEEGKEKELKFKEAQIKLQGLQTKVGNIVHETVIISDNEDNNNTVKTWNTRLKTAFPKGDLEPHYKILERIDGYDPKRGQKVVGHRGYFLKDEIVLLNQALINYGISFLRKKGYTVLHTPFMITENNMKKCVQLEDFDEALYTVSGDTEKKYLIATSEQAIASYHGGEWFDAQKNDLPLFYCGYSSCFRKEAGAHGKDTLGLFRVHQFEKIEQFVFCEPESSWKIHEQMIKTSEEFYESLNISYRVVGIVSGALNNAAAKKYDLEAYFPATKEYRELVSCSNCTDYQSRELEIRYGKGGKEAEKVYLHCLNGTLTATERTLSCILENYQQEDGVAIPEVLKPYMDGIEFLKYKY
eukprot:GHVP01048649.1.p1 GENE.GHVP01048649.1~~GHVP01048649.1.p1  ORF type:complete len:356 (+),score=68.66 GHVP01048649.1:101-1168(+)